MDARIVKAAVDRTLVTNTRTGLKGDQEQRQQLREAVTSYVERLVQHGQQNVEELVAAALRNLRSLETRESSRGPE